jgi:hypothetical protein
VVVKFTEWVERIVVEAGVTVTVGVGKTAVVTLTDTVAVPAV